MIASRERYGHLQSFGISASSADDIFQEYTMDTRQGKRFQVEWTAHLGHPDYGHIACKTLDVSIGGALCLLSVRFPLRVEIEFDIDLSPGLTVQTIAIFVREKPVSDGRYAYGVHIIRFTNDTQKIWVDAMMGLLRQSKQAEQKGTVVLRMVSHE